MSSRMIRNTLLLAALMSTFGVASAANLATGKKFANEVCAACHGLEGNNPNPDFPKLAGQHPDYLAKALRDYQTGARNNAIMKTFVTTLTPADIESISAWYAAQPRALTTNR